MATPAFKLAALDLQRKINPLSTPGYFMVGVGQGQVPTAVVDVELLNQECRVLSSLPEKWRRMTARYEGLIAVRFATAGQTTFTPALKPTGDTQVFVRYPSSFGGGMKTFSCGGERGASSVGTLKPYAARTAEDAASGWTIDGDGEITLAEALAAGDHVIVDSDHDSMDQCHELRMCVLELAAAEMLRGYPSMSENISEKVGDWEKNAQMFLKRLWNADDTYRTGVQFFDRLKLVGEMETRITGGTRRISPGFGGLL